MRQSLAALVAVLTFAVAPARAGIVDSPVPILITGEKTFHVYSVPGIIINVGGVSSFFNCTSLDVVPIQVGVELFGLSGGGPINNPVTTSLSLAPGATVIFSTGPAAGFLISSNLGSTAYSKGSARILATSKKLACTAFLADSGNAPPTSMVNLTIIAKTKQKAAN